MALTIRYETRVLAVVFADAQHYHGRQQKGIEDIQDAHVHPLEAGTRRTALHVLVLQSLIIR